MRKVEDLIAEARALDAAATPGPWVESDPVYATSERCSGISQDGNTDFGSEIVTTDSGYYGPGRADANFIMRARTLLPALAEALEIALQELANERESALEVRRREE